MIGIVVGERILIEEGCRRLTEGHAVFAKIRYGFGGVPLVCHSGIIAPLLTYCPWPRPAGLANWALRDKRTVSDTTLNSDDPLGRQTRALNAIGDTNAIEEISSNGQAWMLLHAATQLGHALAVTD
jgi:hypothetical protein